MARNPNASITMADVAERAGVSIATVSRYINRSGPVSDTVAERIEGVMQDLHYVPNSAAQQLASARTTNIGLLLYKIHSDFFGPLLLGIETASQDAGYNLLVATYRPRETPSHHLPVGPHNTDGLIIYADSLNDAEIKNLQAKNYPMVLIHRSPPEGLQIPSVTVENKAATQSLISHLIEDHRRCRILFFRGPIHQEDSTWREIGFRAALESHGIDFDPQLVLDGEFERETAYANLIDFLDRPDHPVFDAIFTGDDDAAIGILEALHDRGLRVPEDISVAGFDDAKMSTFLTPPLTTVRAPTQQVGQVAVAKLIQIINRSPVEDLTLLPTEIILRRSCGCH